jgi:hypothetical protein
LKFIRARNRRILSPMIKYMTNRITDSVVVVTASSTSALPATVVKLIVYWLHLVCFLEVNVCSCQYRLCA